MEGVGRMAMVADPWGALFYIMTPTPPADQPDATSDVFSVDQPQHVRWNDLASSDQDGAIAFYTKHFGWTQQGAMPMGEMGDYKFIQFDGVGIGAIMRKLPQRPGIGWTFYIGVDDIDRAVAEYQKLVAANPADAEAAAGLAMAQLLQRTQGVDLNAAREAAAADPDDVDAQALVADLDLLGGHVNDAFSRLVELVRRTSGDDRDKARVHLIELFAVVGNEDPRVLKARRDLASALF